MSSNNRIRNNSLGQSGVRLLKKLVYENYEDPSQERRRADREEVIGDAKVSITGPKGEELGEVKVFVRDASRKGCGLWSRVLMPVGSTVMLTGTSGESRTKVNRLGRVRHCRGAEGTGYVVGVEFDSEGAPLGQAKRVVAAPGDQGE